MVRQTQVIEQRIGSGLRTDDELVSQNGSIHAFQHGLHGGSCIEYWEQIL